MADIPKMPGFKIVKLLGKGGVATVYEGLDLELNRKVAIKFLTPDFRQPLIEARFAKEARIAANLYHSNIVSIFDVGYIIQGDESINYLVMEYLDETLKMRLKKSPGFRLTPGTALGIAGAILKGLCYAHKEKILHRDIKPENIMFRGDGTPVVMDFGIARVMDALTQLTRTGMTAGTPEYMSPEQINAAKDIDGRTDIYSLGVMLFEMLSGTRPYKGENAVQLALQHLDSPIPQLPDYLQPYQPLINRMMAKKRDERLSTLEEFLQVVERIKQCAASPPPEPTKSSAGELKEDTVLTAPPENIDSNTVLFFDTAELEGRVSTKQPPEPPETVDLVTPEPVAVETPGTPKKKNTKTLVEIGLLVVLLVVLVYVLLRPPGTPEPAAKKQAVTIPVKTGDTASPGSREKYIPGIKDLAGKIENIQEPGSQNGEPAETTETKPGTGTTGTPAKQDKTGRTTPRKTKVKPEPAKITEPAGARIHRVRSKYRFLESVNVEAFIHNRNIYEHRLNPTGNFQNKLEKHTTSGGTVIVDKATGLMWYNGKPSKSQSRRGADKWLKKLNKKRYYGVDNWRLPTVEEAATLLEKIKSPVGLHLNKVFKGKLTSIWTGDRLTTKKYWIVLFSNGIIYSPDPRLKHYVLPVRVK